MRVIIGCEESQIICKAFRAKGHDAYSCDLQDCSGGHPEWHIKDDLLKHLDDGWDMMIAHPPCTYLSYAATKYWNQPGRAKKRLEALEFFRILWQDTNIPMICLENPVGIVDSVIEKHTQIIHPYYFGESSMKRTCLWLKNLPPLLHSEHDTLFETKTHIEKPQPVYTDKSGKKRHLTEAYTGSNGGGYWRSKTFKNIALAMAEQWTN